MTEDQLEQEALGWLAEVGYTHAYGPDIAPDGAAPERADYRQVVLVDRLRNAIARLNPEIPTVARDDALKQVLDLGVPSQLAANQPRCGLAHRAGRNSFRWISKPRRTQRATGGLSETTQHSVFPVPRPGRPW